MTDYQPDILNFLEKIVQRMLVPQIAQQAGHALFQPGEQVGKACGILRQIAPRVLVHQCGGKVSHGGIVQLQKGAQPGVNKGWVS